MTLLAAAVILLLATHFSASTPVRPAFVAAVGEPAWLGLYSLVAFGCFGAIAWAYSTAPTIWWAAPTPWMWHLPHVLMPLALWCFVASVTTKNPALAMSGPADPDLARGMLRITRHPMLWGTGLWSLAHLVANPDVASTWLFGGMAVLSFGGMVAQEAKKRRDGGEAWTSYAAVTSVVPFAAILAGRQRWPTEGALFVQLLGGLLLYVAIGLMHGSLFGVAVFGAG